MAQASESRAGRSQSRWDLGKGTSEACGHPSAKPGSAWGPKGRREQQGAPMPAPRRPAALRQPLLQTAVPVALRCWGGLILNTPPAGQSSRAVEDAAWLEASQAQCSLHPMYEEVLTEENKHLCLSLPCLPLYHLPKHLPGRLPPKPRPLQLVTAGAAWAARGCHPVRCPRTFALVCLAGSGMPERPWAGRTLPGPPGSALAPLRAAGLGITPRCRGAPHHPAPPLPCPAAPAQLPAVTYRLLPPPRSPPHPAPSTHPLSPSLQRPPSPPRAQHPPCSPAGSPSTPRTPPSPPTPTHPCRVPRPPAQPPAPAPPQPPGPGCPGAPGAGACAAGSPAGRARRKSGAAPAPVAPPVPSAAPAPPPRPPSPRSCAAAPGCCAAAAGGGGGATAAAAAGPRRSSPPCSVGSARDGAGRGDTGGSGGRHRGRCRGRCGGGNRAPAPGTAHRQLSVAHRLLRTGYGVPAAAQRGPGTGQCGPGTLRQLLRTCYWVVGAGCSVPGTGYGTPATTCHTPSAEHRALLRESHTIHRVARCLEPASAEPTAMYQLLGAARCALHSGTGHQAASSQHWHGNRR